MHLPGEIMNTAPSPVRPPAPPVIFVRPPEDPNATIETDTPCRKCSYNLRGLTHGGRCPECGTPVGLSTFGDLLRYSDPNWLVTLGRGIGYILWGILVAIVVMILGAFFLQRSNPGGQEWLGIVAGLLGVYGAWLLPAAWANSSMRHRESWCAWRCWSAWEETSSAHVPSHWPCPGRRTCSSW